MITPTSQLMPSGRMIDLAKIEPEDIDQYDISRCLFGTRRWRGDCPVTVAQHSLFVMRCVQETCGIEEEDDPKLLETALLHDASEAYTGDIATPLKRLVPEFKEIEDRIQRVISERYDLFFPLPDIVKRADARCLAAEVRDFYNPVYSEASGWGLSVEPYPEREIVPWPEMAPETVREHCNHLVWDEAWDILGMIRCDLKNGMSKKEIKI